MRVLSGTQPSGELHIGNYFGALRQYLALQEDHECLYFIADYHSMTSVRDGKERVKLTRDVALITWAVGSILRAPSCIDNRMCPKFANSVGF